LTRLIVSELAAQSIIDQADYYLEHGGTVLGLRDEHGGTVLGLRDAAVTKTISSVLDLPEQAAKRNWSLTRLRGLRAQPVDGFPNHLIFYFYDRAASLVHVIHVLHGARNLESHLGEVVNEER
jgi:plasmid stabilization system protein ParE